MSEEKLYAVKDAEGQYWDFEFGKFRPVDRVYHPADFDKEHAKAKARDYGGHVVAFVEEPKKVVLSKEQAQIVEDAHDNKFPADYITGNSDHEKLLMEAFVNGYTVKKEKKYRVLTPKSWWSDSNVPEYLFHNRGIGYTAFPDGHDTSFTKKQLESYGLDKAPFTKEEVTDDGMGC
ncbi:DUF1642 domain-containing protein [Lacticaseibacillus paracasei]|uniref:DUF1642 domain-containing protein n=1 Tax=Lacticaseibacillus paracasei TaxID=1597 RepID=UPI000EB66CE8|nr:DUF1642 domain-containing protein [Lacticaseibacillus paracasei]AYG21655.1 DUF1642 domain-containing protein [Lacticaseibacillus paracasei]